jgi:hypothetical protein
MTTQHQTIAFCVLAAIAVPLGTFYTFKAVNKFMRPTENRLIRRHQDIELNYIEPGQSHNYPDLLESPAPIYDRIFNYDRVPSYYSGQHAPSYFSGGNPPSFNTIDRGFIHCSLENENFINLYFI